MRPGRSCSSGRAWKPLRPGCACGSGCARRSLRPGCPWNPLRPGRPCSTRQPLRPSRPRCSRRSRIHQLHIQRWCVCRQVVLLAVELHHRGPSRERQSEVRCGRADPSLHQRRHIHRDERSVLAHRKDPGRAADRRFGRIGHAVLAPGPGDRRKAHQPRRGYPVAVEPQHGARHLPRGRPRRQQRQVELQQRGIAPAHVQIGDCPAIDRRQRAVHMRIGHQRRFGAPGLRPRPPQQHRAQHNNPHHHHRAPARPRSHSQTTVNSTPVPPAHSGSRLLRLHGRSIQPAPGPASGPRNGFNVPCSTIHAATGRVPPMRLRGARQTWICTVLGHPGMNSKPFRLPPPLCRSIFPGDSHRVVQNPSISLPARHLRAFSQ